MTEEFNPDKSLITHWTTNLVGSGSAFSINLLVSLIGGILYSFKLTQSVLILAFFGVVLPALFTLCLYGFIKEHANSIIGIAVPKPFISRAGNSLLMLFDIFLITGFALFIYYGPLNYFLFRFIQTVIFPCLLLIFLRVLFLSRVLGRFLDEDNE